MIRDTVFSAVSVSVALFKTNLLNRQLGVVDSISFFDVSIHETRKTFCDCSTMLEMLYACRDAESHSGARETILARPLWEENFQIFQWRVLVYFILLSHGGAPKRPGVT